jgi:hypothetical protein
LERDLMIFHQLLARYGLPVPYLREMRAPAPRMVKPAYFYGNLSGQFIKRYNNWIIMV